MLVSRRRSALREGVFLSTDAFVTRTFRLHHVHNRGVVSDDLLHLRAFPRRGFLHRPVVTVVLEGAALFRGAEEGAWLEPGDVAVLAEKAEVAMRQSRDGEPYRTLVFEWDGSVDATRLRAGRVEDLAALRALGDALLTASDPLPVVRAIVGHLGAVAPVPSELSTEPVPARTVALVAALDEALSNLRQSPMTNDVLDAIALSPRQLGRVVPELHRDYGFNAEGWRDARNRRRVMFGATFMSAEGATVAEVAEAVGYGSAEAFTHALGALGLPTPREIPAVLRGLAMAETIR
ncbi:MAG: helix-turn-helix transcriptional regulator [Myxococcales bacterium]|nr:helix-turn-helix transcriptional regulator [Myxococcales bacterium]